MDLQNYIKDSVDKLIECDTKIRQTTQELVQRYCDLRKSVHLFKDNFITSGSIAEGGVLARWFRTCSDSGEVEIDCMWSVGEIPNGLTNLIRPVQNKPGFVTLKYDEEILQCFLDHVQQDIILTHKASQLDYLNPTCFRERAAEATHFTNDRNIANVILGCLFGVSPNDIYLKDSSEITGATACVEVTARKGDEHIMTFSLDNVPCITINQWPNEAAEWIHRERTWPLKHTVNEIYQTGCHIVPKSSTNGAEDREWRYSFSVAEKLLANARTHNQNRIYMIIKILFYKYIKCIVCPSKTESRIPSFHVKTVMFWFCEKYCPEHTIWADDSIEKAIVAVFDLYLKYLQDSFLPNYFLPKINLLEDVDTQQMEEAAEMLNTIRKGPLMYVPFNIDAIITKVNVIKSKCDTLLMIVQFSSLANLEQLFDHLKI